MNEESKKKVCDSSECQWYKWFVFVCLFVCDDVLFYEKRCGTLWVVKYSLNLKVCVTMLRSPGFGIRATRLSSFLSSLLWPNVFGRFFDWIDVLPPFVYVVLPIDCVFAEYIKFTEGAVTTHWFYRFIYRINDRVGCFSPWVCILLIVCDLFLIPFCFKNRDTWITPSSTRIVSNVYCWSLYGFKIKMNLTITDNFQLTRFFVVWVF